MRLYVYSLWFFASFSLIFPLSAHADANNTPGVKSEKLLETEQSWDGTVYKAYPEGTPQLSVLKITISPYTSLAWHEHPAPNVGYILEGVLTVEKKSTGEKRTLKAGEVLPETVDIAHRGYTGKEGATILVFYAGKKGLPLSRPAQ
ncbi:cupin domain-containing protein [Brucella intermedia]|uniref:cupin domain-containing protein n=1 Tax=Brucella intermedia TaxID=94625 RepID=UPI00124DF50B|nr:cupin domain-containing protein [Brucella intermedia]KAB2725214.1 cupin [Brucella intermedia]